MGPEKTNQFVGAKAKFEDGYSSNHVVFLMSRVCDEMNPREYLRGSARITNVRWEELGVPRG